MVNIMLIIMAVMIMINVKEGIMMQIVGLMNIKKEASINQIEILKPKEMKIVMLKRMKIIVIPQTLMKGRLNINVNIMELKISSLKVKIMVMTMMMPKKKPCTNVDLLMVKRSQLNERKMLMKLTSVVLKMLSKTFKGQKIKIEKIVCD